MHGVRVAVAGGDDGGRGERSAPAVAGEGETPWWVHGLDDGDRRAWVAPRAAGGHGGARRRRRHVMVMIPA